MTVGATTRLQQCFSPGVLAGITLEDWQRLLRDNAFDVDLRYMPRAVVITLCSLVNTALRRCEDLIFERSIMDAEIQPPVFILGLPRSGTTFLHQLFAVDKRFATPTLYQVRFPHTFLCTETIVSKLTAPLLPTRRAQDNVSITWQSPAEEEGAICVMSLCSRDLADVFPRRRIFYARYGTLEDVSTAELEAWKEAMIRFLKKLTHRYNRPLVLKTPANARRVSILAELFPNARFVYLCRNPYDVFRSRLKTHFHVMPYRRLQHVDQMEADEVEWIIRRYRWYVGKSLEEKQRLGHRKIAEIRFEDLERDPVSQMRSIYTTLDLPDFQEVEPALGRYAASIRSYSKNIHPPLPGHLRQRLAYEWRQMFETWGYPV
jgi:hypothetical protein